ncbi:MAG TPA: roadblock/LC7 domain-containing protein [Anaerolineales bacterium]|nr:roadblock/LC7 domain-containing protein [Anaerolineales bacterium]
MPLSDLLHEVNSAPGVSGCLLFSAEGEVLAAAMPGEFGEAALATLAHNTARSIAALEASRRRVQELDLTFQQRRLIIKNLRPGHLSLLCARTVNLPLLNLSITPTLKKISAELKAKAALTPKPQPVAKPSAVIAPGAEPAAEVAPPPAPVAAAPTLVVAPTPVTPLPPAAPAREPLAEEPAPSADSALLRSMIQEAQRVVIAATEKGIDIRVAGSVGVHMHCPKSRDWMVLPTLPVIELVGRQEQGESLVALLAHLGFEPRMRLFEMRGVRHFIIHKAKSDLVLHVFLNAYEVFHRVEFLEVLTREAVTLPPTHLLLSSLQVVDANEMFLREVGALLAEHDLGVGSQPETLDASHVTDVCAEDWGWFRTATTNLDMLMQVLPFWKDLPDRDKLRDRIGRLRKSIEGAPKSIRWQMRARVGEAVRWYQTPIQDLTAPAGE